MRRTTAAIDLGVVLVFVGIGRSVHAHGLSVSGMASTAWPFVSGLAAGWLGVVLRRLDGTAVLGGLVVWISTVAIGMILRVISGQGIALAFVFVAFAFLGAAMLGWRVILAGLRRLRPPAPTS